MTKEKNRFARAVDWLLDNGEAKSQEEIAKKMGTTTTTISRNKCINAKKPSNKTLGSFNRAYGHIINIDYLRGTSDTMLVKDLTREDTKINTDLHDSSQIDQSSMVNAIIASHDVAIASKDETISSLERELATKTDYANSLQGQVNRLQKDVDDWKAQAKRYQKEVETLRAQLAQQQIKDAIGNYPFTVGAAEGSSKPQPKAK